MKTKKNHKNSQAKNSGAFSSQRVLVMSIVNEVTSSDELQGIILPMRLLLAMKQRHGSKLTAEVSISIFRESTKTDSLTRSSGTAPNGVSLMKEGESYVQGTLPLMFHTSARKRRRSGSR